MNDVKHKNVIEKKETKKLLNNSAKKIKNIKIISFKIFTSVIK